MRRLFWLAFPSAALILSILAWYLSPHPSGMGTHQALGLPPCFFLSLTGILCPSCGLTTSWAHLMHGNFSQAWQAHFLGPIFYVLLLLLSLYGLCAYFGKIAQLRQSTKILLQRNAYFCLYMGLGIYFGQWILRLALEL